MASSQAIRSLPHAIPPVVFPSDARKFELACLRSDLLRSIMLADSAETPKDADEANRLYGSAQRRARKLGYRAQVLKTSQGQLDVRLVPCGPPMAM